MGNRLAPQPGEWIDRSKPIEFRFEGRDYRGFAGDVVTSALWANDVRTLGRSFKYHRPRSLYSLAGHDGNIVVDNGRQTNLRGDLLPIASGLDLQSVNTLGGVRRDYYRFLGRFSRFLPVGFYYKAFHTPRWMFPIYEKWIRKVAGLGRIRPHELPPASPKDYDFCELVVIGAGPSGMAAAVAAAEQGIDVLLVEQEQRPGGSFHWQRNDQPTMLDELLHRAEQLPNLRVRCCTQAAGWYADQWVALIDSLRLTKLRTQATLLATGCIEQPAVFQNNDAPGVMLGSAAQRLIRLYAVKPFERAVVLTANADGYRVVLDLHDANVEVVSVVDLRTEGEPSPLSQAVSDMGISVLRGHTVSEAVVRSATSGLASATVCPLDANGQMLRSSPRSIACDGIVVSVGWAGNTNLLAQAGSRFRYEKQVEQLLPAQLPEGVFVAGRVNGVYGLEERLEDGRSAGLEAAKYLGKEVDLQPRPSVADTSPSHPFPIFEHPGKKCFVDFDEDVHLTDIANAHQEGFDSVELLKRYATIGMGPSQGKLANMNAVRVLAKLNGKSVEETGTATGRPFYHPVSIGHLAGRRFHPYRHTPMDAWHRAEGAKMVHAGAWFRPEYYPGDGRSREQCILDEARCVRSSVGLIDISTLGKCLVTGPDAARFLEQIYTGHFTNQKSGTVRYAAACDEAGIVVDEGLVARLDDDRFYITTTSSGSEAFYRNLQRWVIVLGMNLQLVKLTGQWAAMNLAGPESRRVLRNFCDVDLEPQAFPPNGVREGSVVDAPALIMRSGFLGELSYELHLPVSRAKGVWTSLLEAGRGHGIRPFGIEAQRLMRLEKGHLILGHDTDALTHPLEVGLDSQVKMDKPFFVGQRSLEILRRQTLERKLVGIAFTQDYTGPLPEECQLVIRQGQIAGRVTSIAARSTLGYPLGLAFVAPDLAAPGTPLQIRVSPKRLAEAKVTELPFYDPEDSRQK